MNQTRWFLTQNYKDVKYNYLLDPLAQSLLYKSHKVEQNLLCLLIFVLLFSIQILSVQLLEPQPIQAFVLYKLYLYILELCNNLDK